MFAIAELIAVQQGYQVSRHSSFPDSFIAYAPAFVATVPWVTGQKAFSLLRKRRSDIQPALRLTLEGMLLIIVTMTYLLFVTTVGFFITAVGYLYHR
jgi:hypothetical protein